MVKDILREIKTKWFQFLAIALITALGVGFLAGIRVTGKDMRLTLDHYMESSNAMTQTYRHSLGVDQEMVDTLATLSKGSAVGIVDADTFVLKGNTEQVVRMIDYNEATQSDLTLVEGRLPIQEGEVVLDDLFLMGNSYAIGDTLEIVKSDIFEDQTLTVVGFAKSNQYLNLERGSTSLGSGNVSGFMYGHSLKTSVDASTIVRIHSPLTDQEFQSIIDKENASLSQKRFERATEPKRLELDQARSDYDAAKLQGDDELLRAKQKLTDSEKQLALAAVEIQSSLDLMASQMSVTLPKASYEKQVGELKVAAVGKIAQLEDAKKQYYTLQDQVEAIGHGLIQIDAQMQKLEASLTQLDADIAQTTDPVLLKQKEMERLAVQKEFDALSIQGDKWSLQLEQARTHEANAQQGIEQGSKDIQALQNGIAQVETGIKEYRSGVQELEAGKISYEDFKTEYDTEMADGLQKLEKAEKDLANADHGRGLLATRAQSIMGYDEFYQDSDRIEAIGKVFPLIFFGVAILVTLSTMSRMVEESRSEVGVYKALGYSSLQASMKFIGFAGLSWVLGSIIGMILGFWIIPVVIYDAYRIMYQTPALVPHIVWSYAWLPLILSFGSSVGVASFKSMRLSKGITANLLRPALPSGGQRILLERIPFLWNRLSFLYKVSLRNLFRNKTRFWMTIIGIGGCTGLLITGFGLRHSIYSIVDKQFDSILAYDGVIAYHENIDLSVLESDAYIDTAQESVAIENRDVNLIVADDMAELSNFIRFNNRKQKTPIDVNQDSVIITEKLAILEGYDVGDSILVEMKDETYEFIVGGIAENYVQHYIFMSRDVYTQHEAPELKNNTIFFTTDKEQSALSTELLKQEDVFNVSFMHSMRNSYQDMMGNFDIVIYVVVGAAFALELIVLMNLITMNIAERKKELATLKVLGFYPKELAQYILRENILMTLVSIVLGIAFGYGLHQFVILQAELDAIMFNRELLWTSVVLSIFLTFTISIVINLLMARHANKVNMSEALKTFDE